MLYGMWLVDQLELAAGDGADAWRWDADAWLGGETQRIVLESEGERRATGAAEGEVEVLLLYDRAVSPFWNVQLGLRQDILFGDGPDAERTFAVLGLEGVAPLWIELEPRLFVSDDGDTSLRLEATHELSITQRLVAQSRVELDAALGNARRFGVRSGLSGLELGLRIRYELRRELAPYLGVIWHRTLGHTRSLAREQDDPVDDVSVLVGVRFWY
jgi:copper resistance protein B